MKKIRFIAVISTVFFIACRENQKSSNSEQEVPNTYSLIELSTENVTPTVDISTYKLVSDPKKDRRKDAREILTLKRKWPLAMQSLNPAQFDSILSKDFTFKGTDIFFNRADYIKNRTTPDEWKIIFVKYDNVTLQFFGETGILSYVNHITNKNSRTGSIEYEQISWVDMYVIEAGKWKIGASHSIDYRLEIPQK